jgi:hypothetical protein
MNVLVFLKENSPLLRRPSKTKNNFIISKRFILKKGYTTFPKTHEPFHNSGVKMLTWSTFHTEKLQILGATIQSLVAWATIFLVFVHPLFKKIVGIVFINI